ncbi:MAG: hypothetical protein WCJ49_03820 [Deltaproteobacteria bacterium]
MCLIFLKGLIDILWPKRPATSGGIIKKRLKSYLDTQESLAPQRGRGAYFRRFVENAWKVTKSYWDGLFSCYDDPRIPQTSNQIEGLFGKGKKLLRKCSGRKTTANGPGSSSGGGFIVTVALQNALEKNDLNKFLRDYTPELYRQERNDLRAGSKQESRRRQFTRRPEKFLEKILENWEKT